MTYLERFDATPESEQFALARGWLDTYRIPTIDLRRGANIDSLIPSNRVGSDDGTMRRSWVVWG